ncbi:hypothetical protein BVC80_1837g214 [Macleaya cordata]|uniref:Uncharacterized protein n=1 Tax=Macleaya cordata TaxID=56857 RepID=A0A200R3Z5_MACCD|nr:hypothetical protein BVC80_1837g214 [Macleaya cordata]
MAETKTVTTEDPTLLAKRKPNSECLEQVEDRKKQKPEIVDGNLSIDKEEHNGVDKEEENGERNGEVSLNGKDLVDRKGKGIMKEDKGKAKLTVEDHNDEDEDEKKEGEVPLNRVDSIKSVFRPQEGVVVVIYSF